MKKKRNKKTIGIVIGIVVLLAIGLLFYSSTKQQQFVNQCSLDSCPSGYSSMETYCDDSLNRCYRVCEKELEGYCGNYGSFSIVAQKQIDWFGNLHHGESFNTPFYMESSSHCYKFYSESNFNVYYRGSADSYKLYSLNTWDSISECKDAYYSGTVTTSIKTLGRGIRGSSNSAAGKMYEYGGSTCEGGQPWNDLEGSLNIYLYASIAPWVEGGVVITEVSCTYECERDSDCGTDGYIGSTYCKNDNVYQKYGTYDCLNYDCDYSETEKLKETCIDGCSEGVCIGICTPTTCLALGKECGTWDDGCGGTLNCGTCETGYTCENGACVLILPTECETNEDCKDLAKVVCDDGSLWYHGYFCDNNKCAISMNIPPESCIKTRECETDEDCETSYICEDSVCVLIPPTECTSGDDKCDGSIYYICQSEKWISQGEIAGKCGVDEDPTKVTYYRFSDNVCSAISIYSSDKIVDDYLTLVECQSNVEEEETNILMIVLISIIGLLVLIAIILLIRRFRK